MIGTFNGQNRDQEVKRGNFLSYLSGLGDPVIVFGAETEGFFYPGTRTAVQAGNFVSPGSNRSDPDLSDDHHFHLNGLYFNLGGLLLSLGQAAEEKDDDKGDNSFHTSGFVSIKMNGETGCPPGSESLKTAYFSVSDKIPDQRSKSIGKRTGTCLQLTGKSGRSPG